MSPFFGGGGAHNSRHFTGQMIKFFIKKMLFRSVIHENGGYLQPGTSYCKLNISWLEAIDFSFSHSVIVDDEILSRHTFAL